MILPAPAYYLLSRTAYKYAVDSNYLRVNKKKAAKNRWVGIKFAKYSAINSVLTTVTAVFNQLVVSSVDHIAAIGAGRKQGLPDSYVTWTVMRVRAQGSNEPSVLCQSTFL